MSAAPWMPLDCARLAHGLTGSGRVGAQLEEPYKRIFIICNGVDSPEGEVELFSKLLTDLRDKCALEDVASGSAPAEHANIERTITEGGTLTHTPLGA